jgi:GxxExxY protein
MPHEFEELSGRVLSAAVVVHKALGPGFLERVYQRVVVVALKHRGIPLAVQEEVRIVFEGKVVGVHKLDLLVGSEIIVELNCNSPTLVVRRVVLRVGIWITKTRKRENTKGLRAT